jgi:UDP-N-acetyl-D-mannosaminuronic acid dehydrogenase
MIAESYGLDFNKIYDGMTYKYDRLQDFPRAGFAAGPCLLKDTMQLASFNKNNFMLGHAAMLVNEGLPNFIIDTLKRSHNMRDKTVGILGMAFKADVDDIRESLSFKLKKNLEFECKRVLCSDPYVKDPSFLREEELIQESDVVILGVPHASYKNLGVTLANSNKVLIDIWHFFGQRKGFDQ